MKAEMINSNLRPPIVIFLVHGTFGKRSRWHQDGSSFRQIISAGVPNSTIVSYIWSGKNKHRARDFEAQRLAELIAHNQSINPKCKQFVIAHSHGGTLLMYALKYHPELGDSLSGIVTLGTPFIQSSPRLNKLLPALYSLTVATSKCVAVASLVIGLFLAFVAAYTTYAPRWLVVVIGCCFQNYLS